jgi:hypothetical protein
MSNIFQICETGETMKIFQWFLQEHLEEENPNGGERCAGIMTHFNATHIPDFSEYQQQYFCLTSEYDRPEP